MPVNKSRKLSRGKTVHWDSNVDLRSPDSKKQFKDSSTFTADFDIDDGISVVGFKKQIKTSEDKTVDKKVFAKKNIPIKKKPITSQWKAKEKTTPPNEEKELVIFKKLTRISPATVLVPAVSENELDSDISLSEDLEKLLNSSPRNKQINKRILKDLEVLNSLSFSQNSQDLPSSRSVGNLTFQKTPQNIQSSLSFNDLSFGLHSRRSLKSERSDKSSAHLQRHSKIIGRQEKQDNRDSSEFDSNDPFNWRRETYERDRHTFITSDIPDEDIVVKYLREPVSFRSKSCRSSVDRSNYSDKEKFGNNGYSDDDLASQSLGSLPSPSDILFQRNSFLFSPNHESVKDIECNETKFDKIPIRSTVVNQVSDRSDPTKSSVKDKNSTDLLKVGKSPSEPEKLLPKEISDVTIEPIKIIQPLQHYGSVDLISPEYRFDSPTGEEAVLPKIKKVDPLLANIINNTRTPSPKTEKSVADTLSDTNIEPVNSTSKSPSPRPRSRVNSETPEKAKSQKEVIPRLLQPEIPQADDSPWGTPRDQVKIPNTLSAVTVNKPPKGVTDSSVGTVKPVLSLRRLAFNKLRSDFDEKKITPRILPTGYTAQPVSKPPEGVTSSSVETIKSVLSLRRLALAVVLPTVYAVPPVPVIHPNTEPQYQSDQPNPGYERATLISPRPIDSVEDIKQINTNPETKNEHPFLGANLAYFVPRQSINFPSISGFPYPDLLFPGDSNNLPSQSSHFGSDDPSLPLQRVIILGNPDHGPVPEGLLSGVPLGVLNHLHKSKGPIVTEIISSSEEKSSKDKRGNSSSQASPDSSSSSQSSSSSSSSGDSDSDVPSEDLTETLLKRQEGITSESESSPTQFLKNIKQIGKRKQESSQGSGNSKSTNKTENSYSEMNPEEIISDRQRRPGVIQPLPKYYKPSGTQYLMRSKSTSRETSANTSQSSHASNYAKHEAIKQKLETIESARDPHNFDPGEVPDFDDSDIEAVYEGKDMYVLYLKTDDGEVIGPLRLDIEDIELGLPGVESNDEGMRNRQTGSHGLNEFSSRSHSMLTVAIDSETPDHDDDTLYITKRGKLTFVDLAGSEKVRDTNSTGGTLTEANSINKSLLILGNCISHLGDSKRRQGHIPYRDSKLTKLLADSLGGNGVTLMIACVTPSSHNSGETLNTLRYASRAKKIKTKPIIKMDPREKFILSLKREIKILRNENHYLRQQLDFPAKPKGQLQKENDEKFMSFMKEQQRKESGLYEMLQEYMVENEALRSENSDHHSSKDRIRREQQGLYRENEKLMKRVEELEKIVATSPQTWQQISRNSSQVENPDFVDRGSPRQYGYPVGQSHPTGQQYPASGQGHQGSRGIPTRLPPQDLPKPDPNQLGHVPNNRTRLPPPPGGAPHPSRPPHRLSDSINRPLQGQLDVSQNGVPDHQQGSPKVRNRQASPNRPVLDRKVSQSSNSEAIHGMNAKLKSELLELEGEIAQHQRYAQRRNDMYTNPHR